MNYYLYKLRFTTPFHIGDSESARSGETATETICADTLFSAFCHATLQIYAQEGLNRLINLITDSKLRLSDAFPYYKEHLFIPKPYMKITSRTSINDHNLLKKAKALKYISINHLPSFLNGVRGTETPDYQAWSKEFSKPITTTRVNLREEQSQPYQVHALQFEPDCGLYGIIQYYDEADVDWLKPIIEILGFGGIGGKSSSGYGKFTMEDEIFLDSPEDEQTSLLSELLNNTKANRYISMTTSLPKQNELENVMEEASYGMKRRGGFVYASNIDKPFKKHTQYFFSSGSVFQSPFEGDLWTVARTENHPVYRYGKPIFLGVSL